MFISSPSYAKQISEWTELEEVIVAFSNVVRVVVSCLLIGLVTYGGWVYMTSGGDPDKLIRAKRIISAAVIGFLIVVFAPQITRLVVQILGYESKLFDYFS